jgi:uncharacterized protein
MLGTVARKLRIFGFDTLYIKDICDNELLKIGIEQRRIILTCDKTLFKQAIKKGVSGVLLKGVNENEDLVHVLSASGVYSINFDICRSRCSVCNGSLVKKKFSDVKKNTIPAGVILYHKEFFECINCDKMYWEGNHFSRIRSLINNLNIRLRNSKERRSIETVDSVDRIH